MSAVTVFPPFVTELPEIELPIPGARGWLMQGEGQQTVFAEFDQTFDVPAHKHKEQWEIPVTGKVTLHRGGSSRDYLPGESFFIEAGDPHGATIHAGYKAIIVFNEPSRYKPKR